MRSVKTQGGLTRGRGMSENVCHMWVLSLNDTAQVHEVMTEVFGLATKSSEQHAEMGKTRGLRDHSDCQKFFEWLQRINPFMYDDECLHSLSLGLVSDGKDGINCERSEELGHIIQEKLDKFLFHHAKSNEEMRLNH